MFCNLPFHQKGKSINHVVVTYSVLEPSLSVVNFSFLPCFLPCERRRKLDEQPWCFKCCWGVEHVSRYCLPAEKCEWCAAGHDTRSCLYRLTPTAAADALCWNPHHRLHQTPRIRNVFGVISQGQMFGMVVLRDPAPSQLRVLQRCRSHPQNHQPARFRPLSPDSATVISIRQAVAFFESRCTAFTICLDAIDPCIKSLISQ